ncbi:MAG: type IV toxin-antitoxin system AbiEi family antitoxin domain-containing protein [Actinomycetota bacterium]|nr:type IV toxin-antitoxin system AbiEi family antitoxin domain-containing protein [Actinomycetota bacterium]
MVHARGFALLLCGQIHLRARGLGHDEAIARLAAVQFGVVGRAQLITLGLSKRAIEHRLAAGRLRPIHRGVYAVGHEALGFEGRVVAAVLAVGRRATASHRTAAALGRADVSTQEPIHVTAAQARCPQPGIVLHRAALPPDEIAITNGIPVTTWPRTFLDLSRSERAATLRRLIKDAEFKGDVDFADLAEILERYPRKRGRRALAEIVRGVHGSAGRTRSEMEDLFTEFLAAHGLPEPERNARVALPGRTIEVDCLWRDARLALELDGRSAHATQAAFEDDRARDRALVAARWQPMRVTWTQLKYDADALAADLRATLSRR